MTRRRFAFETELGWMAMEIDGDVVCRLTIAHRTEAEALSALRDELAEDVLRPKELERDLIERLRAYAAGEAEDFRDIQVDASYLTPLGRAVFERCRQIPWGDTRTYGRLAVEARRPGAARAVGQFMASNRTPLLVPCHRVVAAGGGLGGFTAPGGLSLKRRLLALERAERSSESPTTESLVIAAVD